MSRALIIIGCCFLSFLSVAQVSTPDKRKFNVGLYLGLDIVKQRPLFSADFNYKGSTLRVMPNYKAFQIGYTQEFLKLSTTYYNLFWTGSIYGGYHYEYDGAPYYGVEEYQITYNSGTLSTGLKSYFGKRFYSHLMGGVKYSMITGGEKYGVKDKTELKPYFEFGIGVLLYKTYPKLKPEETEE